ncbi:hypothetical protein TNCT_312291 [Trichonephila clavata]|uniref:Uncharacterized protein n=1 Tax=Trichonephila clavata TaxID=2740835 RepID=A0A8X6J7J8_TRICU|nr:hypothetical protein TNCT_312291 [Trichonephila clavata]
MITRIKSNSEELHELCWPCSSNGAGVKVHASRAKVLAQSRSSHSIRGHLSLRTPTIPRSPLAGVREMLPPRGRNQ